MRNIFNCLNKVPNYKFPFLLLFPAIFIVGVGSNEVRKPILRSIKYYSLTHSHKKLRKVVLHVGKNEVNSVNF